MQRQAAPAAAGFHHALAGREPQLAADVIHFGDLGLLEAGLGGRVIGAGISHGLAQPQRIELIAEIVMAVDIAARAAQGVAPRLVQPAPDPPRQGAGVGAGREAAVDDFQQLHQVTHDFDATIAIGVAESHPGIAHQSHQRGAVGDPHLNQRRAGLAGDALAGPREQKFDGWITEHAQKPAHQPRIHRSAAPRARHRRRALRRRKLLGFRGGVHGLPFGFKLVPLGKLRPQPSHSTVLQLQPVFQLLQL